MSETWEQLSPIAAGGSVMAVAANGGGQAWLATGAGILKHTNQGWRPLASQPPLTLLSALTTAENTWWVAGLDGGIVYSHDVGATWYRSWTDQVAAPITCLLAAPRHANNRTLLAGTARAGVLRSTDGGRRWLLNNFGLQNFTILCLNAATDWTHRETAFAGTLDGIYRSSGGGRAWKPSGLDGMAVQAVAASPDFAASGLVIAGTDSAGLYRSTDGGRNWSPIGSEMEHATAINALICYEYAEGVCWLAGANEGQIWRSTDTGLTWDLVRDGEAAVVALAPSRTPQIETVYAGLIDAGLLTSSNDGLHWLPDATLTVRGFQRLRATPDGGLLAIAPTEGVWRSTDDGRHWQHSAAAALHQPILAAASSSSEGALFIARSDGVWMTARSEERIVLAVDDGAVTELLATEDKLWAGSVDGRVWQSNDHGSTWHELPPLPPHEQMLRLGCSPDGKLLVLVSYANPSGECTLWRFTAGQWQLWFRRASSEPACTLDLPGGADEAWVAIEREVWRWHNGAWEQVVACTAPIRDLTVHPTSGFCYLLTGNRILQSLSLLEPIELPWPEIHPPPVAVKRTRSGDLLCLDDAGVVWRWR
ncbi:MAG: hypothetical protein MI924_14705 [Chloroflexales bacterium]|nr:hypothetical protein [Chloroflexales bacterium]